MAYKNSSAPTTSKKRKHWASYVVECLVVVSVVCVLFALILPMRWAAREAARRVACGNNVKQIAIALNHYHHNYGSFPPAYLVDDQNRPLHSWRVLILPYLEEDALYGEYRFDEPWDGPNNRQLGDRIPDCYRCPSHGHHGEAYEECFTNYVAVVGGDSVFHGDKVRSLADITDGAANTVLLAEVNRRAVHWMSPHDISLSALVNAFGQESDDADTNTDFNHPGGTNIALADGATRFITISMSPELVGAMTTMSSGDALAGEEER